MKSTLRLFALLLLSSTVVVACDDDDDSDDTGSNNGDTDDSDSGNDAGSGSDSNDSNDSDDSDSDDSNGSGSGSGFNCVELCALTEECFEDAPDCVSDCMTETGALMGECATALQARNGCVAQLGCEDFEAWLVGDPAGAADYPCKAEDNATAAVCDAG